MSSRFGPHDFVLYEIEQSSSKGNEYERMLIAFFLCKNSLYKKEFHAEKAVTVGFMENRKYEDRKKQRKKQKDSG